MAPSPGQKIPAARSSHRSPLREPSRKGFRTPHPSCEIPSPGSGPDPRPDGPDPGPCACPVPPNKGLPTGEDPGAIEKRTPRQQEDGE